MCATDEVPPKKWMRLPVLKSGVSYRLAEGISIIICLEHVLVIFFMGRRACASAHLRERASSPPVRMDCQVHVTLRQWTVRGATLAMGRFPATAGAEYVPE